LRHSHIERPSNSKAFQQNIRTVYAYSTLSRDVVSVLNTNECQAGVKSKQERGGAWYVEEQTCDCSRGSGPNATGCRPFQNSGSCTVSLRRPPADQLQGYYHVHARRASFARRQQSCTWDNLTLRTVFPAAPDRPSQVAAALDTRGRTWQCRIQCRWTERSPQTWCRILACVL